MEGSPKLLNLMNKDWGATEENDRSGASENQKLELRLGPPGEDDHPIPFSYISKSKISNYGPNKRGLGLEDGSVISFLRLQGNFNFNIKQSAVLMEDSANLQDRHKNTLVASTNPTAALPNKSQKRVAPAAVVGWPPVRSFRKNIATGKSVLQSPVDVQKEEPKKELPERNCSFVKINMDGVPIGRKIDLKAYVSYEKLSYAIDVLFRDLLAVQRGSPALGCEKMEEQKMGGCLLDKKEEYTLVYEDTEGDMILVGDVPWHMFVSTAKRLRVLKTSELSTFLLNNSKQGKIS